MRTLKPHLLAAITAIALVALAGAALSDIDDSPRPPGAIVLHLDGDAPLGLEAVASPLDNATSFRATFRMGLARLDDLPAGVHRIHLRRQAETTAAGAAALWIPIDIAKTSNPASPELAAEASARLAGFMRAWRNQDVPALASFYHRDYRGASGESLEHRLRLLRQASEHTEMLALEHRVIGVWGDDADRLLVWIESVSLARDLTSLRVSPRRALMGVRLRRGESGELSVLRSERGWLPPEAIDPATTVHYGPGSPLATVEVQTGKTVRMELREAELP